MDSGKHHFLIPMFRKCTHLFHYIFLFPAAHASSRIRNDAGRYRTGCSHPALSDMPLYALAVRERWRLSYSKVWLMSMTSCICSGMSSLKYSSRRRIRSFFYYSRLQYLYSHPAHPYPPAPAHNSRPLRSTASGFCFRVTMDHLSDLRSAIFVTEQVLIT